jgi:hypothetical protein
MTTSILKVDAIQHTSQTSPNIFLDANGSVTFANSFIANSYSIISSANASITLGTDSSNQWQLVNDAVTGALVISRENDDVVRESLRIANTGNVTIANNLTVQGNTSFTNFSLTGNTTLGDAAGDTLTINAGTASLPNNLSITGNLSLANNLTVSGVVSGTGFSNYLASPPAIGGSSPAAGSFTALTTSSTVTLNGGTANGVAYLNASKVLTTGTGLVFDGTNLGIGGTPVTYSGYRTLGIAGGAIGSVLDMYTSGGIASGGLQITATSSSTTITAFGPSGGPAAYLSFGTGTYANVSDKMRLDSSGNLGLGVTPSAWGGAGLPAFQRGSSSFFEYGYNNTVVGSNYYFDGTLNRYFSTGAASYYQQVSGAHNWYTAASGTINTNIGSAFTTPKMTLTAAGDLGIGTTSPGSLFGEKLGVYGAIAQRNDAEGITCLINAYSGDGRFGTFSNHALVLQTNNTERLRIDSSGNVSVSSDAGNTLRYLDVANGNTGSSAGSIIRLITSNAAGTTSTSVDIVKYKFGALTINNNETNSAAYTAFGVGASERMRITSAGDLLVGTTSQSSTARLTIKQGGNGGDYGLSLVDANGNPGWISTGGGPGIYFRAGSGNPQGALNSSGNFIDASDIAYKENIKHISYGIETILSLSPKHYTLKANQNAGIGFIAQEIETVIPEIVSGEEGTKGIAYGQLTAVLVKAIQELHAEIESLKQRTH